MILRKATFAELPTIWDVLQHAIEQRKQEGSNQWQNGYPNQKTVHNDLTNGYAYVLFENNIILAYAAIIFGAEPSYNNIKGHWITNSDYAVVHRVATSGALKGKGVATRLFSLIEDLCIEQKVYSIRVDTNFDNIPMRKILNKLNYIYCGEVFYEGDSRKAYEKVLTRL